MAMDGDGWRDCNSTSRDGVMASRRRCGNEERCKRNGDVGAAGGGSDKRQRGIKT